MTRDLCRLPELDKELLIGGTSHVRSRAIQGLVLAAGIAATAWRRQALSKTGAVAASLVGTAVYAGVGTRGSVITVGYFATSSALGRLPGTRQQFQQRGTQRDAVQVLANGGPAAVFSLLHVLSWRRSNDVAVTAFYGSLAAAAADTWATEIGTRWGGHPRSIATGRKTAIGQSGAVTVVGLATTVLASSAIAAAAQFGKQTWGVNGISYAIGGVVGSLADSFLGSLIQEQRWCANCRVSTELVVHTCGHPTEYRSGVPRVNNDVVNFLAVIVGGLTAAALSGTLTKLTVRDGSRVEFVTTLTCSRLPPDYGAP
jgi:uncharacterized protein (TIGR00297 family)